LFNFKEENLDRINEQVEIIIDAIDDKGGQETTVIDVANQTSIADYFIITSGGSSTQVSAIADEVEKQMDLRGYERINRSGYSSARWVLLDYGNVIVHVFHKEERQYYDLERLWESVENIKEDN
jgi:ribosome-associated protein